MFHKNQRTTRYVYVSSNAFVGHYVIIDSGYSDGPVHDTALLVVLLSIFCPHQFSQPFRISHRFRACQKDRPIRFGFIFLQNFRHTPGKYRTLCSHLPSVEYRVLLNIVTNIKGYADYCYAVSNFAQYSCEVENI